MILTAVMKNTSLCLFQHKCVFLMAPLRTDLLSSLWLYLCMSPKPKLEASGSRPGRRKLRVKSPPDKSMSHRLSLSLNVFLSSSPLIPTAIIGGK